MAETRPVPDPVEDGWKFPGWLTGLIAVAVVVCIVLAFIVPPSAPEPDANGDLPVVSATDRAVGAAQQIAVALEAYADAHGGKYPTGDSSTAVFQQLLDSGFIREPRMFYLEMTGKTAAESRQLSPANVAFDVTIPVDITTPVTVPVVFATGYRIDYKPGGKAVSLPNKVRPDICKSALLYACRGSRGGLKGGFTANGITTVDLIPADPSISPGTYSQLTPDGPLP